MSLESKIKSNFVIHKEVVDLMTSGRCIQPDDIHYFVPLEEAQKVEVENKELKLLNERLKRKLETEPENLAIQLTNMTNINVELEAKIVGVNKILEDNRTFLIEKTQFYQEIKKILSGNVIEK